MMKKLISISFFLFLLLSCENDISEKQKDYFVKFYGSYLNDDAYDIEPAPDGGFVVVGSTVREGDGRDLVLMKLDEYGNHASWSPKIFGTGLADVGYSIKVLDDGYIIAGGSEGMDEYNDLDAYIIRTDKQGGIIWEKEYETTINQYNNEAFDIGATNDGGFIFAGYSTDQNNSRKISVVILDEKGNILKRSTRGDVNEELSFIHKLQDGNFVVMGTKLNSDLDFFVLRINSDGNDLDNSSFGEKGRNDVLNYAARGKDDVYFLAGTTSNPDGTDKKILLIKYNLKTDLVEWKKILGGSGSFEGKAVQQLDDGNILLAGDKSVADNKNIILYYLNPGGNVISTREFGSSGDQSADDLLLVENGIMILGKNTFEGNSMITLIKTDREGNLW